MYLRQQNLEGKQRWIFYCPGCQHHHWIDSRWKISGPVTSPTVQPSIVSSGTFRCHLFIRDGQIEYLSDCGHGLRGQTVRMEEVE